MLVVTRSGLPSNAPLPSLAHSFMSKVKIRVQLFDGMLYDPFYDSIHPPYLAFPLVTTASFSGIGTSNPRPHHLPPPSSTAKNTPKAPPMQK